MKTISGFILSNILGWKIGDFPKINKSVVIFAPHTSYYDAFYGKLFLTEIGINHNFLSKKELFFFPMNIVMRLYGSIPVGSVKYGNTIYEASHLIEVNKSLHIILSPEGTRKKVLKWNKGFYYMAYRAKVPIVVGYLDYKKKEIGIKGVIENLENVNTLMNQINIMYKDISAKYPEKFSLELVK
jgi:1-acyl-sn-glycerol-3-phosphate acyltransferase